LSTLDPVAELAARVVDAAGAATGLTLAPEEALLRPGNARHGADFQANLAMSLARRVGREPRDLAGEIAERRDVGGIAAAPRVAGPGFINFRLDDDWIGSALGAAAADARLGAAAGHAPQRVVIDYSAPNIAKEMHVGHLRSTIIGDALARVLRFCGDDVIAQNHVGDWGTPFGMLIEHLGDSGWSAGAHAGSAADLVALYRQARTHFDADAGFADRARGRVVALQAGDPATLAAWRQLVAQSQVYFDGVYRLLGVGLTAADMAGESIYNDLLAGTVDALQEAGLLELSDGALCTFPDGFRNRDGDRMALIVRKSDGGYGYAATDLAAIRHRARTIGAERILYVVGAPQSQHLQMVFATARAAGWIGGGVAAEHVPFGSVLGEDGKILRTRAGKTVKLVDLLQEAVARAGAAIAARAGAVDDELARAVGIGAVKYADLSSDRVSDYVFSFDRMLALEGNTSVYLQYAHARAAKVLRLAAGDPPAPRTPVLLRDPSERALALALLRWGPTVDQVACSLQPHRLCTYLYETATSFSAFYESCPILKAGDPALRASRLRLTDHTREVLRTGLELLGIEAPQRL
jgi:arginyl-tRNA synthetase